MVSGKLQIYKPKLKTYPRKAKINISGGWYGISLGNVVLNTACTVSTGREGRHVFSTHHILLSIANCNKVKLYGNVSSLENKLNPTRTHSI